MGRKSVLLTLVMLAFFMPVLLIAIAAPAIRAEREAPAYAQENARG